MSKFPTHDSFKNHKTKPQLFLEKFYEDSFLTSRNIFPRKFKQDYVYDIVGQKFVDFYLDEGRLYLGFSDKYITRMVKDYLNHTIFSYSHGIFTYRFSKLLFDLTNGKYSFFYYIYRFEDLFNFIKSFGSVGGNTEYLRNTFGLQEGYFVFEPYDEVFNLISPIGEFKILFLGRGIRGNVLIDCEILIIGLGRFFVVMSKDKLRLSSYISEFDAMFGYYYLLRESFLVKNKYRKLRFLSFNVLDKFVKLGFATKLTGYGVKFENINDDFNEFLLKEGILSKGKVFYFSFQHSKNDFERLKRKLNKFFGV
ncbi:MAG: hypothetical protein ACP5PT_01135 [Brevinematia bacterium]